ncbi:MAG: signal peptidase I [Solirubrobacteraceae bacterium]
MFPQSAPARRAIPLRIAGGLGRAVLGLACLALIATLLPSLFGYQRYVLVGHSMEPTIKRGSVIFDEVVPTPRLKVGDVITYVQPATRSPTTHRIVRREASPDGRPVYITKGDNNAHEDLWPFTLDRPTQARYAFAIPYVGYLFILLADPTARILLLALPALLIALLSLARLWREAGVLLEQRG